MKKLALFLILTCFNVLHSQNAYSQLYSGNAYYDSTGKVYYYATDGKAYYYPEHVQRQYQKKPQTTHTVRRMSSSQKTNQRQNSHQKTNTYKKQNTAENSTSISVKDKNLLNANWWKTATLEKLKSEIANGANVKAKANDRAGSNSDGDLRENVTPLMFALKYANPSLEIIETLIKAGADVNAKNDRGITPLLIAARYNQNPEIIKALINAGADVNAKEDKYGLTALMVAAIKNTNPEIIKTLLDSGANINACINDAAFITAALYALGINPNHKIFELLVKKDIDKFCKVNRSYSEEIYYCKDRLTLYMQKEDSLPSCTKNPSAMLAIFPFLQGLEYIDSDKGTYTLVVFADRMSHFNCSISKTFKDMHFYDFE